MDIGEKDRSIRACSDRANSERRPDALTVDDRRPRVPGVAASDLVEAAKSFECSVCVDPQNTGIITPGVNDAADRDAARQIQFRGGDRGPDAVWGPPAK